MYILNPVVLVGSCKRRRRAEPLEHLKSCWTKIILCLVRRCQGYKVGKWKCVIVWPFFHLLTFLDYIDTTWRGGGGGGEKAHKWFPCCRRKVSCFRLSSGRQHTTSRRLSQGEMYLSQRMVEGGQKEAIKSSKSFYPRSSNCASKTVVRRAIIKIYLAITNRRPVCQSKEPSRGREKKRVKRGRAEQAQPSVF